MDCPKCSAEVEFHGLDWYCPSCGAYGHVQPWMMRKEEEEDHTDHDTAEDPRKRGTGLIEDASHRYDCRFARHGM